jgi:hypothetical protein
VDIKPRRAYTIDPLEDPLRESQPSSDDEPVADTPDPPAELEEAPLR